MAARRLIERSFWKTNSKIRHKKPLLQNCLPTRFPLDIQYIILDLLDRRELARVKKVMHWPIGEHYWRHRAPRTLLYELRDVPKDDNRVNWEYLCLGAEKLLAFNQQLTSRVKVFDLLLGPRKVFRRLLREEGLIGRTSS